MKPEDFEFISKFLKERSGLVLTPDKAYLLESRLMPVARKNNIKDLDELIQAVRSSGKDELLVDVTEAMTTNESFFFRDTKPFDLFRNFVLPDLLKTLESRKSFRIFCAAASSGQEPYSLAMILKEEAAKLVGWRHEIIGTDISKEILEKAESGCYSQFEVQRGLPIQMLVKYFTQQEGQWQVNQDIRDMVKFKEYNLLNNLSALGQFDVVFCRNVLIYFDRETKEQVLEGIADLMPRHGMLFLGGAETVIGISEKFIPVQGQRGVYSVVK